MSSQQRLGSVTHSSSDSIPETQRDSAASQVPKSPGVPTLLQGAPLNPSQPGSFTSWTVCLIMAREAAAGWSSSSKGILAALQSRSGPTGAGPALSSTSQPLQEDHQRHLDPQTRISGASVW